MSRGRRQARRRKLRDLVIQRVERALDFAFSIYSTHPEYAVKAVKQAQRLAQKARVRLPTRLRRRFCRKCGVPFVGSSTFSVRVRQNRSTHVVLRCKSCGFTRRFYIRQAI
ncbi:MAG TPA: ribonuclease P [Candidatus Caldiarchaeum subterraneum]|uniref:Ribonuclease P protein component 4 n=1 Tax=Caldiarchaeum subterraneum TaxID=311458 RepID=A0A832ZWR6_CALS0|nr:ribonuclease P [Aigarchaeota archaeon]HIQ30263.1 ribonuclease P [Candidatus Caldarchaeum subterraneum]